MEEGIPIFANNPILQHPEPRCTVRTVRTKTTTDEISEISDWTRTDEIFKILDQFGLNLSGLITWLNPLAVELEIFLRMIYESRHVIHVTFDNVDTLL